MGAAGATNQVLDESGDVTLEPRDGEGRACGGVGHLVGVAQLLIGLVDGREAVPPRLEQVLQVGVLQIGKAGRSGAGNSVSHPRECCL